MADERDEILAQLLATQKEIMERLDRMEAAEPAVPVKPDRADLTPGPEKPPMVQVNVREDSADAQFPEPPPEIAARFEAQASSIFENWRPDPKQGWGIDKTEAAKAYAQAGPLWLAAYAHEYLMGLPFEWRQAMVGLVHEYAPRDAIYLGRDILRRSLSDSKGRAYDVALEAADDRWAEGRGARA
jgi:hypothetical protein